MADNETIADIIAEMRALSNPISDGIIAIHGRSIADRLEAAHKREAEHIHRAMVILAGIEMPDPDYPPKLWTALEDAYDALSDALGTDGDTTDDEEEARANGRHFVIQPHGDAAKLRDALNRLVIASEGFLKTHSAKYYVDTTEALDIAKAALAEPVRNCEVGAAEEQAKRFDEFCHANRNAERCCGDCPAFRTTCDDCELFWAQLPYEEGGAK